MARLVQMFQVKLHARFRLTHRKDTTKRRLVNYSSQVIEQLSYDGEFICFLFVLFSFGHSEGRPRLSPASSAFSVSSSLQLLGASH